MNDDHTTSAASGQAQGIWPLTLYYDASCPLCRAEMSNLAWRDQGRRLVLHDISATPGQSPLPDVRHEDMMAVLHARCADGRVVKGVEVFRLAYEAVGLGWVTAFTRWPLLGPLSDWVYPRFAARRNRFPRWLVQLMFELWGRSAAERASRQAVACHQGECSLPPSTVNRRLP